MALRLEKAIVRGEISNSLHGRITGRLWLLGRAEPVPLELEGNCLRDLAGCTLTFENPVPRRDTAAELLQPAQHGAAGDMTASRKARVTTVSDEELIRLIENKLPVPTRLANCLYLEWFSRENGRVVIETSDYALQIGEPAWTMTAAEEKAQAREAQENFHAYLDGITGVEADEEDEEFVEEEDEEDDEAFGNEAGEAEEPETTDNSEEAQRLLDAIDEVPMNEFEWEQELREGDRRAEAYQEAVDRYKDHPQRERERLIAEAMGWDPAEARELSEQYMDCIEGSAAELLTSGELNTGTDQVHHPLSRRAMNFALNLQRESEARGLFNDEGGRENPLHDVIVSVIALGGKLAAALDPMLQGFESQPGLIIAMLKRAQLPLNEALHAISSIELSKRSREVKLWLTLARSELFDLRKDILDLMNEMRARQ